MAPTVTAIATGHLGARGAYASQSYAKRVPGPSDAPASHLSPKASFDAAACERDLNSYFADSVPYLDDAYLRDERPSVIRRIEQWLAPKFDDARVLELACGTGFWTQTLAKKARGVVAVDRLRAALEMAADRVPGMPVRFVQDDVYNIARSEGRFNAAFAAGFFSHVPRSRRAEFFDSLSQVLVPGTEVVLIDDLHVGGALNQAVHSDADGNRYEIRQTHTGVIYRVLKNYPTETELLQALGKHGVHARYREWGYYWTLEYTAA